MKLSTAFHPQMDGQAKRMIQNLEDMLRAFIIDLKGFGIDIYLCWSFPTTIVFIHPFPWLPMNTYMIEGASLLLDCLKWGSITSWSLVYL